MKKRLYVIIISIIIAIGLSFIYNLIEIRKEIKSNQENALLMEISKNSTDFNKWISNRIKMLNTVKDILNNLSYEELTYKNTLNKYLRINLNDEKISEIYVGLESGDFITGGRWVPPDSYDPSQRIWYKEAIENNKTIVSSVYKDKETGDDLVTISSPLYLENRFIGVIAADVFLNDLKNYMDDILDKNTAFLVNEKEEIVVNSRNIPTVKVNQFLKKNNKKIFNYDYINNGFINIFSSSEYNKNVITVVTKFSDVKWYFIMSSREENIGNGIELLDPRLIIINTFLIIVILFLFRYLIIHEKQVINWSNDLKEENKIDFLTEIYNKRWFFLKTKVLWSKKLISQRVTIMMIDIDFFKNYNDHYGHLKGDETLKKVALILKDSIRLEDVLARYGGEEFIIFLEEIPHEQALKLAKRIKAIVFEANIENIGSYYDRLTISIGLSTSISNGVEDSYMNLIERADRNLYIAKEKGRNLVVGDKDREN